MPATATPPPHQVVRETIATLERYLALWPAFHSPSSRLAGTRREPGRPRTAPVRPTDHRCATCGYGIAQSTPPYRCPMCGGSGDWVPSQVIGLA
jgi:hypothetical protein